MALLISCRPELISPNIAVDMMDNAKGVAHMPTATTTKEDTIQNQAKITHTTSRRGFFLDVSFGLQLGHLALEPRESQIGRCLTTIQEPRRIEGIVPPAGFRVSLNGYRVVLHRFLGR